MPLLPLWAFMACSGVNFALLYFTLLSGNTFHIVKGLEKKLEQMTTTQQHTHRENT
jgi:hypothetical protein